MFGNQKTHNCYFVLFQKRTFKYLIGHIKNSLFLFVLSFSCAYNRKQKQSTYYSSFISRPFLNNKPTFILLLYPIHSIVLPSVKRDRERDWERESKGWVRLQCHIMWKYVVVGDSLGVSLIHNFASFDDCSLL